MMYTIQQQVLLTGLQAGWPKNQGLIPGKDKIFSLLHSIQTSCEAHSASYLMGTTYFTTI
jgi:hypothetical protein